MKTTAGTNACQRGSALVTVLVLIVLLTMVGAAMVNSTLTEISIAYNQGDSIAAQYAAEAGLSRAMYELSQNAAWTGTTAAIGDAQYVVAVTSSGSIRSVTSTGTRGGGRRVLTAAFKAVPQSASATVLANATAAIGSGSAGLTVRNDFPSSGASAVHANNKLTAGTAMSVDNTGDAVIGALTASGTISGVTCASWAWTCNQSASERAMPELDMDSAAASSLRQRAKTTLDGSKNLYFRGGDTAGGGCNSGGVWTFTSTQQCWDYYVNTKSGTIGAGLSNPVFFVEFNPGEQTSYRPSGITFRSASSAANTGGSTLQINVPSGVQNGDVLVASIATKTDSGVVTPAGWERIRYSGGTPNHNVYYRVASGEPASYTWSLGASVKAAGGITAYDNVDTTNPLDNEDTIAGTSYAAPSLTTTVPNAMLVTSYIIGDGTNWAAPDGMTERYDFSAPPIVQTTATTNGSTADDTPTINLPTGIQSGDLLIILFRYAGAGSISWSGVSWNELFEFTNGSDVISVGYRIATGSEGAALTFLDLGTAYKFAALAYRISGARAPDIPSLPWNSTGTNASPNPPSFSPPDGSLNYLWLWMGGWEGEQTSPPSGNPTNYTDPIGANSGTGGAVDTNVRVASARRTLAAATEDPPAWTISAADSWGAFTIAVPPADISVMGADELQVAPGETGPKVAHPLRGTATGKYDIFALKPATVDCTGHTAAVETLCLRATPATDSNGSVIYASSDLRSVTGAIVNFRRGISFRSASVNDNDTGSTSLVLSKPPGVVDGDVMIASIGSTYVSSTAPTAPAGWTPIRWYSFNASEPTIAVYYKVASGEPASYTWTFPSTRTATGGIRAYSGVDTTDPVDVEGVSPNWFETGPVTTTVPNTMLVTSFVIQNSTAWTPPAGMIERYDVANTGVRASDDFNRGDNWKVGKNWDQVSNCSLDIVGNGAEAEQTTDACIERYNYVTWPADQYSQVKIVTIPADGGPGPAVRCSSSANTCYFAEVDSAGGLWRTSAGTYTFLGSFTAPVAGDTLRLEAVGTQLRVKVNGVLRLTVTDTNIASGSAGIKVFANPITSAKLDDWEGGPLAVTSMGADELQAAAGSTGVKAATAVSPGSPHNLGTQNHIVALKPATTTVVGDIAFENIALAAADYDHKSLTGDPALVAGGKVIMNSSGTSAGRSNTNITGIIYTFAGADNPSGGNLQGVGAGAGTTYVLKSIDSDLTGGADFNKELSPDAGPSSAGTGTVTVAASATENSYGFTKAGEPGTLGATGNYTVKMDVAWCGSIQLSAAVARVNSAGTQQAISSFTAEQSACPNGVKTFSLTGVNLGTWSSGDRLRVTYRFRNTTGSAQSMGIDRNNTNTEVRAPWTVGVDVQHAANSVNVTVNGIVMSNGGIRLQDTGGSGTVTVRYDAMVANSLPAAFTAPTTNYILIPISWSSGD